MNHHNDPDVTEVVTSRNEKVAVASFQLSDSTGKLKVPTWRKNDRSGDSNINEKRLPEEGIQRPNGIFFALLYTHRCSKRARKISFRKRTLYQLL